MAKAERKIQMKKILIILFLLMVPITSYCQSAGWHIWYPSSAFTSKGTLSINSIVKISTCCNNYPLLGRIEKIDYSPNVIERYKVVIVNIPKHNTKCSSYKGAVRTTVGVKNNTSRPYVKKSNTSYSKKSNTGYTRRTSSIRCSGTTKKGNRCKRVTKNSSGRCYQH
jgi:hypothetical protein